MCIKRFKYNNHDMVLLKAKDLVQGYPDFHNEHPNNFIKDEFYGFYFTGINVRIYGASFGQPSKPKYNFEKESCEYSVWLDVLDMDWNHRKMWEYKQDSEVEICKEFVELMIPQEAKEV